MDFLIRQILNAEKEGLYVTPVYNRDHNVRKINLSDDELDKKHSLKDTFKNVCCWTNLINSEILWRKCVVKWMKKSYLNCLSNAVRLLQASPSVWQAWLDEFGYLIPGM